MRVFAEYRPGECSRHGCHLKRDTLTIAFVRPPAAWEGTEEAAVYFRTFCVNRLACDGRNEKQRARRKLRSQLLVLAEPADPDALPGVCRWCGDAIWRADGRGPDKRRRYHYPDVDGRDCVGEHDRSMTWDARVAIKRTTKGAIVCADCGVCCEGAQVSFVRWDADHRVPLEDGGEHSLANLQALCCECHKAKTAREATARAARRRAA